MQRQVADQISAIHTMLSAGHRHLRIERHTLALWGLTGAGLLAISEQVVTPAQFSSVAERAVAWLALLSLVFGGVGLLDWVLTKRAKHARDEALSFLHRQVFKVWWLLLGMGVLTTFAMFFFGGGAMLCGVWMVLIGLGLYVHGLFSEEFVEWAGAIAIAIGIGSLGFGLDYETTRWIAASLFGIGLPLLGLMLDRGRSRPFWRRGLQAVVWLLAVLVLPLGVIRMRISDPPANLPVVSVATFLATRHDKGERIVVLPAEAEVSVSLGLHSDAFRMLPGQTVTLALNHPVEVVVRDGEPTGMLRVDGGAWREAFDGFRIAIPQISAGLDPAGAPFIRPMFDVAFQTGRGR